MPEVIEVKSFTDFIRRHILHKNLLDLHIKKGRYKTHGSFTHKEKIVRELPLKVTKVDSKGKFMYIQFENDTSIGATLGLTGGWFFHSKRNDKIEFGLKFHEMKNEDSEDDDEEANHEQKWYERFIERALKHINVVFEFQHGDLYYTDQLSFGTLKVFTTPEELDKKLDSIGSDIMDPDLSFSEFEEHMQSQPNKPIGNVLMNQKLISGVGNYLRSDGLWVAKISPFRKVKDIDSTEMKRLFQALRSLVWNKYDRKKGLRLRIVKARDKYPAKYGRSFFVFVQDTDIYGNKVTKQKLYEGSQVRHVHWVKDYQE